MTERSPKTSEYQAAANRLHHLSIIYSGAIAEVARGHPISVIPSGAPGLEGTRDLIDCALLVRAEVNGITRILLEKAIVTHEDLLAVLIVEYDHLAAAKAAHYGFSVTDEGLRVDAKSLAERARREGWRT